MDPVPTRAERIAALVAILAVLLLVPAAAFGSGIAAVVLLFVAITGGTVAKARTGAGGLTAFGTRSVPDDEPEAERYRERREREAERSLRTSTIRGSTGCWRSRSSWRASARSQPSRPASETADGRPRISWAAPWSRSTARWSPTRRHT
ncbi:hypothetical protein [Natronococcus roseus]|uniref:hypothetical protein n=1 Tax=Natronococcus roseus TaxID=1052014 RepID=UPI00374DF6C5